MKNFKLFIITNLLLFFSLNAFSQCGTEIKKANTPTSIGIVIYSNDTETLWNAMRFANYSKNEGDTVCIFLLGKGVELETIVKDDKNVKEQTEKFLESGGVILGCGTCLQSRKNDEPQMCKFSSMKDLYELIKNNKKILTF